MTKTVKNRLADLSATISGIAVAIALAWIDIDWTTFDIKKEWPRLVLLAVVAISGIVSKVKLKS